MWALDDIKTYGNWHPRIPPYQAGIAFALNDKIYFGLDFYYPSLWFFECDPGKELLMEKIRRFSWIQLSISFRYIFYSSGIKDM